MIETVLGSTLRFALGSLLLAATPEPSPGDAQHSPCVRSDGSAQIQSAPQTNLARSHPLVLAQANGGVPHLSTEEIRLPAKEDFHLFLLVGQSNMAGRGKVDGQDREPHPRVLTLTKDNRWAPAVDPLHFDKPRVVGVGVGRTFGIQIAEAAPDITVGLIPCAAGGSPISTWEPGGFHSQTKSHPYDDAIRRAKLALQSGTLKGILWHQGESDSAAGKAEVYEVKLHALVARLRKELSAPDVPFIAGQMGRFTERPWSDAKRLVDRAHQELPNKVRRTGFVSSDNLAHKGDQVHFDAKSLREFGKRYAQAFVRLTEK